MKVDLLCQTCHIPRCVPKGFGGSLQIDVYMYSLTDMNAELTMNVSPSAVWIKPLSSRVSLSTQYLHKSACLVLNTHAFVMSFSAHIPSSKF